jgi:hypothetical protein
MIRNSWLMMAGAMAALTAPPAQAQQPDLAALDAQIPGTLLNDPTSLAWGRQGETLRVESLTDPAIPGGGAANRYRISRAGPNPYSAQASVEILQDIDKGDTVTVGFWARSVEPASGTLGLRIQRNADPWPGFADTTLTIGPEWKWHEVSAPATVDIAKGNGTLVFNLAGARQTIDIGQAIIVKGAASIAGTAPAATPAPAATVELPEPLRGAGRLVNNPAQRGWRNVGRAGAWQDRAEPAVWLGQATRFTSSSAGSEDVTTTIPLGTAVTAGAKYLVAVVARTESAATDDGKALVGVRVQDSQPPNPAFANAAFKVGPTWQLVRIPVTATADLPADRAEIVLDFARAVQAVDIGPVYVLKVE